MTVRFKDNVKELQAELEQLVRVTIPEASVIAAEDILTILTNAGRDHIPALHRFLPGQSQEKPTGRLWSGWGEREAGVQTNNPDSNERDNVAIIRGRRGRRLRLNIIVGTRVEYAFYANDGRPEAIDGGKPRTKWQFKENAIKDASNLIMPAYEARMSVAFASTAEGKRAVRSFNAAKRRRSSTKGSAGRFAKK